MFVGASVSSCVCVPPTSTPHSHDHTIKVNKKVQDNKPVMNMAAARINEWHKLDDHTNLGIPASEELPPGANQEWVTWKTLHRRRTGMGRYHVNMRKWAVTCDCGKI